MLTGLNLLVFCLAEADIVLEVSPKNIENRLPLASQSLGKVTEMSMRVIPLTSSSIRAVRHQAVTSSRPHGAGRFEVLANRASGPE